MSKSKVKSIVGIKAINYPEKRNFVGLKIDGYDFKKQLDFYKFPAYIYFKLFKKPHPRWLNYFYDFNLGRYQLLHFFNAISLGSKPWVTTFEYYLPRGAHQYGMFPNENKYIDFVLARLNQPSCKKLIAISEFAYKAQIEYLKKYGKYENELSQKLEVIHPPQKLYFESINKKTFSDKIKLVFVGADFFRKGGMEILFAFEKLMEKGLPIELTIVSSMQYGDYASGSTKKELTSALEIINRHKSITHHYSLPNKDVIELFKDGSIALLPTYDETYGYTVLEAQACACPVITTNGGALTEINNNECGWVIEVPLNSDNRTIPRSEEAKISFQNIVSNQLIEIIQSVLEDKNIVKDKGEQSLKRIKANHCVEQASKRLAQIYNSI